MNLMLFFINIYIKILMCQKYINHVTNMINYIIIIDFNSISIKKKKKSTFGVIDE